jgi:hypothetical protein
MMAGTGRTGQLRDGHAQFTLHPPARGMRVIRSND